MRVMQKRGGRRHKEREERVEAAPKELRHRLGELGGRPGSFATGQASSGPPKEPTGGRVSSSSTQGAPTTGAGGIGGGRWGKVSRGGQRPASGKAGPEAGAGREDSRQVEASGRPGKDKAGLKKKRREGKGG